MRISPQKTGITVVLLLLASLAWDAGAAAAQDGSISFSVRDRERGAVGGAAVTAIENGDVVPLDRTAADGTALIDMSLVNFTKGTRVEGYRSGDDVLLVRGEEGREACERTAEGEGEECRRLGAFYWWGGGSVAISFSGGGGTLSATGPTASAADPRGQGPGTARSGGIGVDPTGTWTGDARLGYALPVGDLGDTQDGGLSLGLGAGYWLSPRISLRLDLDGNMLGGSEQTVEGVTFELPGIDMYHFVPGLNVRLTPPGSFFIDGTAGVGLTNLSFEAPEGADSDSETKFSARGAIKAGWNTGSGSSIAARTAVHRVVLDEEDFGTSGWTTVQIQAVFQLTF